MSSTISYIYVRTHSSYDELNAYKLGKADNIPDRDTQYATSEIKRGRFIAVYEVTFERAHFIEYLLQEEFQAFHIYDDGGTEFYDKIIITLIEPYFLKRNIQYRTLTIEEINVLVRCNRVRKPLNPINQYELMQFLQSINTQMPDVSIISQISPIESLIISPIESLIISPIEGLIECPIIAYIPRSDQITIINTATDYFQSNDKGLLILTCGVGKTLISLWVAQALYSNTILIGVPNKLLLVQWETEIRKIFPNVPYLLVSGGVDTNKITQFLENNIVKCIVITTYASAHKVYKATQQIKFVFNMKINDEAHHLTTTNINEKERKTFVTMLKIYSCKQLSLTATLKLLENNETMRDEGVISNDNIEYFGNIINRKCLLWAIQKDIVCDYKIQTIVANEEQLEHQFERFNITQDNDKRLFLSAFASLKSIHDGHSHHMLVYSNNQDNSLKIVQYMKMLLDDAYFDIPYLYYSNYHSEMNSNTKKSKLEQFNKSSFGIITCVYCLGEGYDNHTIDAVVFAENMSSDIRIVQSALRASRKNLLQPDKITKIIVPILNKDDWLENNNNPDLKKVREIIYQMGLEDETITQKIKVSIIEVKKQHPMPRRDKITREIDDFGEYDDELTQRLRLKTTTRTTLGTSYEKARKLIASKNIKNKEEYFELCETDNRLTTEPEVTYNNQFINWIEYLSIERVYYELETCKIKVIECLAMNPNISKSHLDLSIICTELCKVEPLFPPNGLWVDYYAVKELHQVITIVNKKKKMASKL